MNWVSVIDSVPDSERQVLVLKRLKSGKYSVGLGYYSADFKDKFNGGWVCSGSTPVAYWCDIPQMPEE